MTITIQCDDNAFEKELLKMKNQILSGDFQREMKKDQAGFKKVTATFEMIKE